MLFPEAVVICAAMTCLVHSAKSESDVLGSRLDSLFESFNRTNSPGASVIVIRDGRVLFARGYGLADLEKQTPCNTNTNFRLASVTKQFTSMAVMILVERNKLSLE